MILHRSSLRIFVTAIAVILPLGCGSKPTEETPPPKTASSIPETFSLANPVPATKPADPPTDDLLTATPAVTMTAKELTDAGNTDLQGFIAKYKNKVVEVTGTMSMYDYDSGEKGIGYLILKPGINKFRGKDPHPMAQAMPGQIVTLRGRCGEYGIIDWKIAKVEGPPPPTISVDELLRLSKADEDATTKKYRGYLIVTGTIQSLEKDKYGVRLTKPGEKQEFTCSFGTLGWNVFEKAGWLKEGQKVRILGECNGYSGMSSAAILPPEK